MGVPGDLSPPATNFRNEQSTKSFAYVTQLCKQISFRYRVARHDVGGPGRMLSEIGDVAERTHGANRRRCRLLSAQRTYMVY